MSVLENKPVVPRGKGHTKGKKKELIIEQGKMNLMEIKYRDGGEVPQVLQGDWNNRVMAQSKIDSYLSTRDIKAA